MLHLLQVKVIWLWLKLDLRVDSLKRDEFVHKSLLFLDLLENFPDIAFLKGVFDELVADGYCVLEFFDAFLFY